MGGLFSCCMCKGECCGCCKSKERPLGMLEDKDRRCRDLLCCLLFIVFWLGMIVIAAISAANGDPWRLLYATDYRGETCGRGVNAGKRRVVYPRLTQDLLMNMDGFNALPNPLDFKFYGVCVDTCPVGKTILCNEEPLSTEAAAMTEDEKVNCFVPNSFGFKSRSSKCVDLRSKCWLIPLNMTSVFWRCLPVYDKTSSENQRCTFPLSVLSVSDPACAVKLVTAGSTEERLASPNLLYDSFNTVRSMWTRYIGDLQRSWWVIALCGVAGALVLSFVWTIFLKYCTGPMVCLTILLAIAAVLGLTFFCYAKAGILDASVVTDAVSNAGSAGATAGDALVASEDNAKWFKYAAYAMTAFSVIFLLVLIAIRKSIINAVRIIDKASEALIHHPWLTMYPLVTVVLLFGLLAYWVSIAALLFSAGEKVQLTGLTDRVDANIATYTAQYENYTEQADVNATLAQNAGMFAVEALTTTRYLFMYHFFGLLWTNQVIQGIGMMVIAGCVAEFYFHDTPDDSYWESRSKWRVLFHMKRVLRYHLGSICFGGFFVALMQFLRYLFEYIQKNVKNDSKAVRAIKCCIRCCLKIIEKCVEFLSKNAYIYIAVKGSSFCTAAGQAFSLIMGSLTDMIVVNAISEVLLLLGKLVVTIVCGFFTYFLLNNMSTFQAGGDSELTSTWLSVLVSMIFAFAVASGFFYVFDLAIDTVLLCFLIDKREHKGQASKTHLAGFFDPDFEKHEEHFKSKRQLQLQENPAHVATGGGGAGGAGSGALVQ